MRNVDMIFINMKFEQLRHITKNITKKELEQLADDIDEFTNKMIKKYEDRI